MTFDFGIVLEPVGSVKPNVNIGDKGNIANGRVKHQIDLLCPAQAFPVPAHRYSWTLDNEQ